ncbi:hypothetical protein NEPAR06_1601 [Nematocida parisii]|uniref:Uncharacterized protein n=1 Tax=Nematocida parisii (strain ERTm3) TaxID=935791 RepID=I3EJB0_NEMP3|nr:uncharacterized protein NEPG_02544 [Nematocida parisii ERTm1]EIJ89307.1 hypothetical protein NEQG_00077 [Nematocida parisii ERTm3]EIJ92656.1 hypothetical protein NEPG_02544 [Nematocida parisii ERTm1]KAI5142540.1 hypothetical protein NEPAR07_0145 [Nematocida parisii]KAI5155173.1 hypothetical protein NEPAR06_1601 [Nematocida parisii]|eukprot:XP_013060371.1 hypothetical protein NEPG_02544 [Nematocida parisii ERTm1]
MRFFFTEKKAYIIIGSVLFIALGLASATIYFKSQKNKKVTEPDNKDIARKDELEKIQNKQEDADSREIKSQMAFKENLPEQVHAKKERNTNTNDIVSASISDLPTPSQKTSALNGVKSKRAPYNPNKRFKSQLKIEVTKDNNFIVIDDKKVDKATKETRNRLEKENMSIKESSLVDFNEKPDSIDTKNASLRPNNLQDCAKADDDAYMCNEVSKIKFNPLIYMKDVINSIRNPEEIIAESFNKCVEYTIYEFVFLLGGSIQERKVLISEIERECTTNKVSKYQYIFDHPKSQITKTDIVQLKMFIDVHGPKTYNDEEEALGIPEDSNNLNLTMGDVLVRLKNYYHQDKLFLDNQFMDIFNISSNIKKVLECLLTIPEIIHDLSYVMSFSVIKASITRIMDTKDDKHYQVNNWFSANKNNVSGFLMLYYILTTLKEIAEIHKLYSSDFQELKNNKNYLTQIKEIGLRLEHIMSEREAFYSKYAGECDRYYLMGIDLYNAMCIIYESTPFFVYSKGKEESIIIHNDETKKEIPYNNDSVSTMEQNSDNPNQGEIIEVWGKKIIEEERLLLWDHDIKSPVFDKDIKCLVSQSEMPFLIDSPETPSNFEFYFINNSEQKRYTHYLPRKYEDQLTATDILKYAVEMHGLEEKYTHIILYHKKTRKWSNESDKHNFSFKKLLDNGLVPFIYYIPLFSENLNKENPNENEMLFLVEFTTEKPIVDGSILRAPLFLNELLFKSIRNFKISTVSQLCASGDSINPQIVKYKEIEPIKQLNYFAPQYPYIIEVIEDFSIYSDMYVDLENSTITSIDSLISSSAHAKFFFDFRKEYLNNYIARIPSIWGYSNVYSTKEGNKLKYDSLKKSPNLGVQIIVTQDANSDPETESDNKSIYFYGRSPSGKKTLYAYYKQNKKMHMAPFESLKQEKMKNADILHMRLEPKRHKFISNSKLCCDLLINLMSN